MVKLRALHGQDKGTFITSFLLISIPATLFGVFVAPQVWNILHPSFVFVAAWLFCFSIVNLLLCGFVDPGFLPKMLPGNSPLPRDSYLVSDVREVIVAGNKIKLKHCNTCNIWRPPRCSHCSICDFCVLEFDHHCPWTGNCVAKKNYRFFTSFVLSCAVSALFFGGVCLALLIVEAIQSDHDQFLDAATGALGKSPVAGGLSLYCFLILWAVGGLGGFHVYLISTSQTTNEQIKDSYAEKKNPYNQGLTTNWISKIFPPWYFSPLCCGHRYLDLIDLEELECTSTNQIK